MPGRPAISQAVSQNPWATLLADFADVALASHLIFTVRIAPEYVAPHSGWPNLCGLQIQCSRHDLFSSTNGWSRHAESVSSHVRERVVEAIPLFSSAAFTSAGCQSAVDLHFCVSISMIIDT
jgi:hypothetical protein